MIDACVLYRYILQKAKHANSYCYCCSFLSISIFFSFLFFIFVVAVVVFLCALQLCLMKAIIVPDKAEHDGQKDRATLAETTTCVCVCV